MGTQEKDKKAPLYLGVQEVSEPQTIPSATKGFVTILKARPTAQKAPASWSRATSTSATTATRPSPSPTGRWSTAHHYHPFTYTVTVAPGAWDLSPVQVGCDTFRPGRDTIELQAEVAGASPGSGAGVTFASRSMLVVQFGPIFVPPG